MPDFSLNSAKCYIIYAEKFPLLHNARINLRNGRCFMSIISHRLAPSLMTASEEGTWFSKETEVLSDLYMILQQTNS